jgi:GTP-binding protein EngB required for normal cell division
MNSLNNCDNCPVHNTANLVKLGLNMEQVDYVITMAGNPNTGKSTVFNNLTGLRQHTGNWPGKTVIRAEGGFIYNDRRYKVVDLPAPIPFSPPVPMRRWPGILYCSDSRT